MGWKRQFGKTLLHRNRYFSENGGLTTNNKINYLHVSWNNLKFTNKCSFKPFQYHWLKLRKVEFFNKTKLQAKSIFQKERKMKKHVCIYLINGTQNYAPNSLSFFSCYQSSNIDLFNLKEIFFPSRILALPPRLFTVISCNSICKRTNNNGTENKTKERNYWKKYLPT